jgi:hypothetical protein
MEFKNTKERGEKRKKRKEKEMEHQGSRIDVTSFDKVHRRVHRRACWVQRVLVCSCGVDWDRSWSWLQKLTLVTSGQAESGQRSNNAKGVVGEESSDLTLGGIRLEKHELRSRSGDHELLLGPRKLTQDHGDRVGGRLDGQRVEKHV